MRFIFSEGAKKMSEKHAEYDYGNAGRIEEVPGSKNAPHYGHFEGFEHIIDSVIILKKPSSIKRLY
jgi:hypothetical protein